MKKNQARPKVTFRRLKSGNYSVYLDTPGPMFIRPKTKIGHIRKMPGYWRVEDADGWIICEDDLLSTAKSRILNIYTGASR